MAKNKKEMRTVYIIALLLFSMTLSAQSRYSVYKSQGRVEVMKFRTDQWVGVNKNDEVLLMDILKIPDDGALVILDAKNRNLYKMSGAKEKSLKALIDESVRRANDITYNLNKELLSENKPSDSVYEAHRRIAASFRGTEASASYLDSLCSFIVTQTSQDSHRCWYYDNPDSSDKITYDLVPTADGEYYFKFCNNLLHDIFINVVYSESGSNYSLCYEFDYSSEYPFIIIPAGQEVSLPQYLFPAAEDNGNYHVLASDKEYDTHALQMLLKKRP